MKYQSTRGNGGIKTFEEVLLSTYASDGGMWVPENLPQISRGTFLSWSNLNFSQVCAQILHLFTNIEISILENMTKESLKLFNNGNDPIPITKHGNLFLLDCSLGPTFAFKDIGLQIVSRLLNYVLGKKNKEENLGNKDEEGGNGAEEEKEEREKEGEIGGKEEGNREGIEVKKAEKEGRKGKKVKANIVIDTSGDTGPAAIA